MNEILARRDVQTKICQPATKMVKKDSCIKRKVTSLHALRFFLNEMGKGS